MKKALIWVLIPMLLSGCEMLGGSRKGDDPKLTIDRLQVKVNNLESQIRSMERNSGQLEQQNSQLQSERNALKNRLNAAVVALDKFRSESLSMLSDLVNNSNMLQGIGNETVPRTYQLQDVRIDEPQLLVDHSQQLQHNFKLRAFAAYFNSPTRVQLWLLRHDPGSEMYTVLFRSKTYNTLSGEQTFFLDRQTTISSSNVFYGLYFPQGNISVPYHKVNPDEHGAYYSNTKRLADFGIGNLVGLNERKELNGAKFSWQVLGI